MAARHLVIGGGTAGLNAIRTIREEDGGASEITLVSAERPYSRMVLPYYLGASIAESHVYTATPASLAAWKVKTMLGRRARVAGHGSANAHSGRRRHGGIRRLRDRHRLTRGAAAHRRRGRPGVHSFWTLDEARAVIAAVQPGTKVVMVGAGFISFTILNAILARRRLAHHRRGRSAHPASHGRRGLRQDRGPLAGEPRRDAAGRGVPDARSRSGRASASSHSRRATRSLPTSSSWPRASGPTSSGSRDRASRSRRSRRRHPRGRSPALEREERLCGGRRGARTESDHGNARGPCHRAHRPGARARGGGESWPGATWPIAAASS